MTTDLIGPWLDRWALTLEGEPWSTPSSHLALVRRMDGSAAVLKIPHLEEERRGCRVLAWWAGHGAAQVYEIDPSGTVLMERAGSADRLRTLALTGKSGDLEATEIMINRIRRLHDHRRATVPDGLRSLRSWFRELFGWADRVGGFFGRAAALADLLDDQRDVRVLHGDVHHENVLWFGPGRGWLAIDPKGLLGDPIFDYLNLLTNPTSEVVLRPGRFEEHVDLISDRVGVARERLLAWTVAWAGLSAAWNREIESEDQPSTTMQVGRQAECLLIG